MQTVSRQHSNNVYQQTRKIAIVAIILFALSGLISGFAVGAFVHPKAQTGSGTGTSSNTGSKSTPNTQVTHSPVTTLQPIRMGDPVVTEISTFQKANASTPYIFTAHALTHQLTNTMENKFMHLELHADSGSNTYLKEIL